MKGEFVMKRFCSFILGLILMLNLTTPALAATAYKFTDIKSRDYFYDAALWAAKNDIEHLGRIYWLYDKEKDKWQRPKILRTIKDAVK